MFIAILGSGLMGATVFFTAYQFLKGEVEGAAAERLDLSKRKTSNGLLKIARPMMNAIVTPYVSKIKLENWRKVNRRYLISAGLEEELDTDELIAFKIFLGAVVPVLLFVWAVANRYDIPLWVYPGAMLFLFIYPSLWVKGARKRRQEEIKLQLPFVIDLLTLSTEAGLDFIGALQKVVEKARPGPLVSEIERMLQEIQLGTTRADSLRNLAWRIDLSEISSFVAVLVTADQMGSPLGDVLRVQSDLIRSQRFSQAEKKGAAASQKLLFPLIFFIMPAVFIMIFGPMVLGLLAGN